MTTHRDWKTGLRADGWKKESRSIPQTGDLRRRDHWWLRGSLALAVLLCGILGLPWWSLLVPAFTAGLVFERALKSFVQVALVTVAIWCLAALYQDVQSGGRMSVKISSVLTAGVLESGFFGLGVGPLAYLLTGLVAGLAAGLAAWCGQTLKRLFSQAG